MWSVSQLLQLSQNWSCVLLTYTDSGFLLLHCVYFLNFSILMCLTDMWIWPICMEVFLVIQVFKIADCHFGLTHISFGWISTFGWLIARILTVQVKVCRRKFCEFKPSTRLFNEPPEILCWWCQFKCVWLSLIGRPWVATYIEKYFLCVVLSFVLRYACVTKTYRNSDQ